MKPKYWVIIPAAGIGHRFGGFVPKQYLSLNGKPIIEHTLAKFLYHASIAKVVVSVDINDGYASSLLRSHADRIIVTQGGATRNHSVLAGLNALADRAGPQDFVLVHDAVRPCVHHADIDKLISEVGTHPVGGILGVRVRDTLKHANGENEIVDTLSRENIWQAQTPQMFRYKLLQQALQAATRQQNSLLTDEASAIEALGFVPMIVEGRSDNIKITYPEDFTLAEKYL